MTGTLLGWGQVFKSAATEPLGPARPCKYGLNALMQVRVHTLPPLKLLVAPADGTCQ